MNKRMIAYILGILLLCEAGLMLLPTVVSLIYGESAVTSFLISIALLVATGLVLVAMKPKNKTISQHQAITIHTNSCWCCSGYFYLYYFR